MSSVGKRLLRFTEANYVSLVSELAADLGQIGDQESRHILISALSICKDVKTARAILESSGIQLTKQELMMFGGGCKSLNVRAYVGIHNYLNNVDGMLLTV